MRHGISDGITAADGGDAWQAAEVRGVKLGAAGGGYHSDRQAAAADSAESGFLKELAELGFEVEPAEKVGELLLGEDLSVLVDTPVPGCAS